MNIDDYRAMVQAEQNKASEPETKEEEKQETTQEETQETQEEQPPAKLVVDDEEFDADTIRALKAGNLRTQDYTKKTQEAAQIKREAEEALRIVEYIKTNPKALAALQSVEELAPEVAEQIDPVKSKVIAQERELNDLRLRQEIASLQEKYDDFEVVDVLKYAYDNKMPNLELAYTSLKGTKAPAKQETPQVDVEAIKADLRKQLLEELASEQASTSTIITSKSTPPETKQAPTLSAVEAKVAKSQGLTEEEYMKWKTKK